MYPPGSTVISYEIFVVFSDKGISSQRDWANFNRTQSGSDSTYPSILFDSEIMIFVFKFY